MEVRYAPISISAYPETRDGVTDIEITGEGYTLTYSDGSTEDIQGRIQEVHEE